MTYLNLHPLSASLSPPLPLLPLLPSSEERKRKYNDVVASIKRRLERSKTKETKSSVVIQNPERHARIRPVPLPLLSRASPEIQLAVERGGGGELDTLCTRGHVHVVAGGRRWGSKEVAEKEVCREIGGGGGG